MTVRAIVDHARVAIELFSKEEIALRRDAFRPVLFALCRDAYRLGWSCWHRGIDTSFETATAVSDEVVVERGRCWKCKRVRHQGAPIGEFLFGCPTPKDFVVPSTIDLIEEWRSA